MSQAQRTGKIAINGSLATGGNSNSRTISPVRIPSDRQPVRPATGRPANTGVTGQRTSSGSDVGFDRAMRQMSQPTKWAGGTANPYGMRHESPNAWAQGMQERMYNDSRSNQAVKRQDALNQQSFNNKMTQKEMDLKSRQISNQAQAQRFNYSLGQQSNQVRRQESQSNERIAKGAQHVQRDAQAKDFAARMTGETNRFRELMGNMAVEKGRQANERMNISRQGRADLLGAYQNFASAYMQGDNYKYWG
jgi:hypothetical protein